MWPRTTAWEYLTSGGSVIPAVAARSSLSGQHLADLAPSDWEVSAQSDGRKVTSTLRLRVPDPDGTLTVGLRAPLGFVGQRLTVRAGFDRPDGGAELVPMGVWQVTDPGASAPRWSDYGPMRVRRGGVAAASGVDLLALIEDDDFTALTSPVDGGTVRSEVLRIVGNRLPVAADWPGVDGTIRVPPGPYSDNRLTALCDVLALAGAVAWVNRAGALQPIPATKTGVDRVISGATVVSRTITGGRDGLYNRVIVTGADEAGTPLLGVASESGGPLDVHGPYGVVVRRYGNPLGKDQIALDKTAHTYLRQGIEARAVRIELVLATPDYAIDPLDRVTIDDPDGPWTGMVQSVTHDRAGTRLVVAIPWGQVWR